NTVTATLSSELAAGSNEDAGSITYTVTLSNADGLPYAPTANETFSFTLNDGTQVSVVVEAGQTSGDSTLSWDENGSDFNALPNGDPLVTSTTLELQGGISATNNSGYEDLVTAGNSSHDIDHQDTTPTVSATDSSVDEDDIAAVSGNPGGPDDLATPDPDGAITYNLFADTPVQSLVLSTTGNTTNVVTLDGTAVLTTWDANSNTLIGYRADGDANTAADRVFTIAVTNITDSGADYDVTLLQPIQHHLPENADDVEGDLVVPINVSVFDSDGSEASTSFNLTIDDDTPVIGSFADLQVDNVDGASNSGSNSGFLPGADGWGDITLTGPQLEGVTYSTSELPNGTVVLTANDGTQDIFTLSLSPDGNYEFVLLEAEAGTVETDVQFDNPQAGSPTTGYDFGDVVATPSGINDEVNPSNTGLAGDGNSLAVGEAITFTYDVPQVDTDQVVFGLKAPQGGTFNYVFYDGATVVGEGSVSTAEADGELVINAPGAFTAIELVVTESPASLKIQSMQTIDLITAPGQELPFTVDATDGDGDAVTGAINVQVAPVEALPPEEVDTVPTVTTSNDIIVDEDDIDGIGNNNEAPGDDDPVTSGTINFNLGTDQPLGSIALSTGGNTTALQTLAGQSVDTVWVEGTQTLIAYIAGTDASQAANQVFTVQLANVDGDSADYQVTLLQPVRHAGDDFEDNVDVTVDVTVTDADGDPGSASFVISIDDDIPVVDDIAPLSLSVPVSDVQVGGLGADWTDIDGTGGYYPGINESSNSNGVYLRWGTPATNNGQSGYNFSYNPNVSGGTPVEVDSLFEVGELTHLNFPIQSGSRSLESVDLEVEFNLVIDGVVVPVSTVVALGHNETPNDYGYSDPRSDDIITITNPGLVQQVTVGDRVYEVRVRGFLDGNGNLVSSIRTQENRATSFKLFAEVASTDDLPELSGAVTGSFGADGPAAGGGIVWTGASGNTVAGDYGTLVVDANGGYTYEVSRATRDGMDAQEQLSENFEYSFVDASGDRVTKTLTINLNGEENQEVDPNSVSVQSFGGAERTTVAFAPEPEPEQDPEPEQEPESEPEAGTESGSELESESATEGALLATEGDDVFAFALSDASADEPATIVGFGDSGTDTLDLRDLLQGEEAEGVDLTSYLKVSLDGADTVIEVSSDGGFKGNPSDANFVDYTVTLEGVDLVTGYDDMSSVIQSMLDSGKLTIDQ
ncbi:MAG: hypothetical protein CME38_09245, partial [Haliea sp.]|nr:hypothetical protein [Haliea sp.]